MGIKIKKGRSENSIILTGRVAIEHAAELHSSIRKYISRTLKIDMTEVEMMDASIIQLVLAAAIKAKETGVSLVLVSAPLALREALVQLDSGFRNWDLGFKPKNDSNRRS